MLAHASPGFAHASIAHDKSLTSVNLAAVRQGIPDDQGAPHCSLITRCTAQIPKTGRRCIRPRRPDLGFHAAGRLGPTTEDQRPRGLGRPALGFHDAGRLGMLVARADWLSPRWRSLGRTAQAAAFPVRL